MTNFIFKVIQKAVINPTMNRLDRLEDDIAALPEAHRWIQDSPIRFEIMKESQKRGMGGPDLEVAHLMPPTIAGQIRSMASLKQNPAHPKTTVPEGFLSSLEAAAKKWGVSSLGYTRVPNRWIFRNKAILHLNAMMLSMEMDKVRIDTVPSIAGEQAVIEIYRDLGIAVNKITSHLRKHGYSAHAAHPLMGPVLYPPLAQMAGLGWLGANGLLITPEHGPRVRLAAVFTSIENLPFNTQNDNGWVGDFCAACGICVSQCPAKAIMPEPARHKNGQITCVINSRCFPYFSDHHGCSVCIKVCPFNNSSYDKIKHSFEGAKSK